MVQAYLVEITASDQATIESDAEQTVQMENNCVEAGCSTGAPGGLSSQINLIKIEAQDDSKVDSNTHQDSQQNNDCATAGTQCTIFGSNSITLTASDQADIENEADLISEQDNKCESGASCSNIVNNLPSNNSIRSGRYRK